MANKNFLKIVTTIFNESKNLTWTTLKNTLQKTDLSGMESIRQFWLTNDLKYSHNVFVPNFLKKCSSPRTNVCRGMFESAVLYSVRTSITRENPSMSVMWKYTAHASDDVSRPSSRDQDQMCTGEGSSHHLLIAIT